MSERNELRMALVGFGAIGRTVTRLLAEAPVRIVAVADRDWSTMPPGVPAGATTITSPDELAATEPDLVVEAAGQTAVGPWGHAAVAAGADYVVSSISAFTDASLLASLREAATRHGAQVLIQPGALGGVDALAAARIVGIDSVEHRIIKPPGAWRDTPAEDLCTLDALDEPTPFFTASATEAAAAFPKNANVAMTTALAGIGPDLTRITLVADPTATTNQHRIRASGAFGELDVHISNNPLPDNPKTSAMAAYNLVRTITNRATAIVI